MERGRERVRGEEKGGGSRGGEEEPSDSNSSHPFKDALQLIAIPQHPHSFLMVTTL